MRREKVSAIIFTDYHHLVKKTNSYISNDGYPVVFVHLLKLAFTISESLRLDARHHQPSSLPKN